MARYVRAAIGSGMILTFLVFALSSGITHAGETTPAATAPVLAEEEEEVVDLDAEEGSLPKNAVSDVLKKNDWAVTDCVTRLSGKTLDGRVEFAWEITLEGKVDKLRVNESSLRNPPLQECLQKSVQRLTFPAPRGGVVRASHVFAF